MSTFLRFAYRSILALILLVMVTTGTKPDAASAQGNAVITGTNLIQDPRFDAFPYDSSPWKLNGTVSLCTASDEICQVPGIGYNTEFGWAWLGNGTNTFSEVYQYVRFPKCGAQLEFNLFIGRVDPGSGSSNYFVVEIDNEASIVFQWDATQANSYNPYKHETVPVSQFADGRVHNIIFYSNNPDTSVYYSVDDVALYATSFDPASGCAQINVKTKDTSQGTFAVPIGTGDRKSYSVNNGPVFMKSINNVPFIAAERVLSKYGTQITHFSELMGLPQSLVSKTYAFPVYDNYNFNSQLRFGNVSTTQPATVRVFIGQDEISKYIGTCTTSPPKMPYPFVLAPNESMRVSCKGVDGRLSAGPVKIVSNQNIVASLRVIYQIGSAVTSFSEMMGLPDSQWDTTYWMPWYNFRDLNSQLRIANVSASTAHVHIFIGGTEINNVVCTAPPPFTYPYQLPKNESLRVSCPGLSNGPVKILSDVPIVASLRVARFNGTDPHGTDFSEVMGLPDSQKTKTFFFPWYNTVDLDSQVRFANLSTTQSALVHIYIGGKEMLGSPFIVSPGQSTRQSFAGINDGPVEVVGDQNIVASLRVICKSSLGIGFSELMGLPDSFLTTSYVLPWYNNIDLNTQVRFGVP